MFSSKNLTTSHPNREMLLLIAALSSLLAARAEGGSTLVLAVATHPKNHFVLDASRDTWRKDVFTIVSTSALNGAPEHAMSFASRADELWFAGPDGDGRHGWEGRGGNAAEQRCTGVMRIANASAPAGYDWILHADDDVVWLLDNARATLATFDADAPYFVTDGFLNAEAWTGCAPKGDHAAPLRGLRDGVACERAVPQQPCTRAVLSSPGVCGADVIRNSTPGTVISQGVEISAYGNSGYAVSRGLMRSISAEDFRACEACDTTRFECKYGADFRLGECYLAFGANGQGIGPTVPQADRRGVFGHSLDDVLVHANRVAEGGACDEACLAVLTGVVSVHFSTRGKAPEEYREELRRFYETYERAKARLDTSQSREYVGHNCHPSRAYLSCPDGDDVCVPCMLWRTGTFREATRTLPPLPPLPDGACGAAGTSFLDGSFSKEIAQRWTPAECKLEWLSAAELRTALAGRRILFQGDSMLRQVFNAMVAMLRDERQVVDPWYHADATYSFDDGANDLYSCATTEPDQRAALLPNASFVASFVWDTMLQGASAIDFAAWDAVVASPVHWLEVAALDVLRALDSPKTVYVTTPVSTHVGNANVTERNAWIAERAHHAVPLAEMDAADVFGRDIPDNQHFQCQSLVPMGDAEFKGLEKPPNGDCRDIVNRNAVQGIAQIVRQNLGVTTNSPAVARSLFVYDSTRGDALLDPFDPGSGTN